MASTAIRDRRRTLRYRHLLVRQMVQMKNRIQGLLMETGVSHNKQRLHKVKYFRELLTTNEEVHESIRPLRRVSRDTIVRLQKTEYALVSSLQRDPLLAERIKQLRTVPGVGPITALTWALEMGDVSRFPSIREAISYCGLCGDEKSSADKVMRTPLSKQRNKHIQRVLVEAAKLAPRQDHALALVYEREKQKGNANRATLAVARKMVAYLLAVDRGQRDFVPFAHDFHGVSRAEGPSQLTWTSAIRNDLVLGSSWQLVLGSRLVRIHCSASSQLTGKREVIPKVRFADQPELGSVFCSQGLGRG